MAGYESEYTVFMREMQAKHPEWADEQLAGRAILWDRPINLAEQEAFRKAKEPNRSYPYDANFEQKSFRHR